MTDAPPKQTDTIIIGNGPSALILSFILHGNVPYYNPASAHPDPILHRKLLAQRSLLDVDVPALTAHFAASRISYSTQALPANVLLDTLLRPLADTDPGQYQSCVEWRHEPEKRIPHLSLGNTAKAGGQWADNPIAGSWDIGALSYAEMLSLPRYSLSEHRKRRGSSWREDLERPSRREVAEYLAVYPEVVGISDAIYNNIEVAGVSRVPSGGFYIASHDLHCKHLVLASGTFSDLIPARPLLQPLLRLPLSTESQSPPLLVVGSGFTAADVILSAPPGQKILHIFKWAPDEHPSPLRACHPRAYPEYASVYRKMKLAAKARLGAQEIFSPMKRQKSNPFERADWQNQYEGLPNTYISKVDLQDGKALVTLKESDGHYMEREICAMQYVIGRRGSLGYLDSSIRREILGSGNDAANLPIAGKTLRSRAEDSLELAPDISIIGSLTGDSLIRFAFGGCVVAARMIMSRQNSQPNGYSDVRLKPTKDLDEIDAQNVVVEDRKQVYAYTNGHFGLGQDAQSQAIPIKLETKGCELWNERGGDLRIALSPGLHVARDCP